MQIHGHVDPRYDAVRSAFAANFAGAGDVGASFCATKDGEIVVDLWAGVADAETGKPWERDTIVNVYSTTKTMCALTALLLADRGELDFSRPVADYWPEFAANGKAAVNVAQLMSHSAGLSGFKERVTKDDLYDWDKVTGLLAAQAPFWEPGTAPGYHGITQGYLVGEVVRRITGATLGTVFRTEIAAPLGADFHVGLPASEDDRVAVLIPPPAGQGIADMSDRPLTAKMATNPAVNPLETRTRAWRGAEIPAANGHGNARSVAVVQSLVANGGVSNGTRILSEAGVRRALEFQIEGDDRVLGMPVRYGLGFGLAGGQLPLPNADCCYWGGYGGSLVINDLQARTTFAYAMNKMAGTTTGDMRAFSLAIAMWQGLAPG
ncbi:serine hydrolase domain-containing protein [Polymorphobacter fuscus]|uniref:Serine hydrolase n=1 Tax=Sandarakinorhabdus fusca TaxID=1439888 RepID=A0A7C9GT56_9SPHN|nr:serine hydrolase domain-containing protein [Polymorphobacter fuscus]KAB7644446.1 beta-lactamase family protein [Polymorphobacter fuscus]MQT18371.1 serine hydrolase [Polymorphobacter fuscus]NJC08271.1 CubicO group peptidase (beta-lactamase class C family) [Polymorphobacter fuscus]